MSLLFVSGVVLALLAAFVVMRAAPTAADASPGVIQFTASAISTGESTSGLMVTVVRAGGSSGTVGAGCSTTGGTATPGSDYTAIAVGGQWVSWGDGETQPLQCIFQVFDDNLVEPNETFGIQLTGANLGSLIAATVTIVDNDGGSGSVHFGSTGYTGSEANPAGASVQVVRAGSAAGAISVDVATTLGGTASPNVDFVPASGTLTWADGDSSVKIFSAPLINDSLIESSETIVFSLSNPTGGATISFPSTIAFNIADDELAPTATTPPLNLPPPQITDMRPSAGALAGGYQIQLVAMNAPPEAHVSVIFDGSPCTSIDVTSSIRCTVPAHSAGTAEVVVTTDFGTSSTAGTDNDFHYSDGHGFPYFWKIDPGTGPNSGGTLISITGWNFLGVTSVMIGASPCLNIAVVNAGLITCYTPEKPGSFGSSEAVTITSPSGTNPGKGIGYVGNFFGYNGFRVNGTPTPTVTSGSGGSATNTPPASVTSGGGTPTPIPTSTATAKPGTGTATATPSSSSTPLPSGSPPVYTLYFRYTLFVWAGPNDTPIDQAFNAAVVSADGATVEDWRSIVGAVWWFDPTVSRFKGYFPGTETTPGASDFTTLKNGTAYFLTSLRSGNLTWSPVVN